MKKHKVFASDLIDIGQEEVGCMETYQAVYLASEADALLEKARNLAMCIANGNECRELAREFLSALPDNQPGAPLHV